MTIIENAAALAASQTIAAMLAVAQAGAPVVATKADVKAAISALGENLERNKHKEAVAVMLSLMLWDANGSTARIRREGLFRASRYEFRSGGIIKVLDAALALISRLQLQLRPDRLAYLNSVRVLLDAAPEARRLRESLVIRLKARKRVVLKTLLYIVNQAFARNWVGDRAQTSERLEHWSQEDLAQGFSSIVQLMREEFGTDPKLWQHVDEKLLDPFENIYANLLIDAARLNELLEAEALVDGMPYEVRRQGEVLVVFSTDEMLEKSIRLGYIQSGIQDTNRAQRVLQQFHDPGQPLTTMESVIAGAFDIGMGELVELRPRPIERLVFKIVHDEQFFLPISTDEYYVDEIASLIGIGIENFRPEEGASMRVSELLTVRDVIKVQRMFSFMHAVYDEKLKSIQNEQKREALRMRSVLPIMRQQELVQLLGNVLSPEKAEEAVRLLTLEEHKKEHKNFIDLQYRPLIKAGERFVIAPALIFRSNLVRNIVTANRLRKVVLGPTDPMQRAVVQALTDAGFRVRENFSFNIEGERETDVLCWRDGHLFVLECKNSFHPCSAHEVRTSFEHIKTAADQLDIRLRWLKEKDHQTQLLKWLGWDVPTTENVHSAIITANRVFNGYSSRAHPVRQAHELMNVVLRGKIRLGAEQYVSFWRGSEFQAQDLVDYLRGETIIRQQMAQLQPFDRHIRIGSKTLSLQNYVMDVEAAAKDAVEAFGPQFDASE